MQGSQVRGCKRLETGADVHLLPGQNKTHNKSYSETVGPLRSGLAKVQILVRLMFCGETWKLIRMGRNPDVQSCTSGYSKTAS